jgi:tRNA(Ile)-lysidine synthase
MTSRGSHRPTLLTLIRRELEALGVPARGDVVLVGASGGPDSQALLHAMVHLGARMGFGVCACGVDHGLRVEAPAELTLAECLARELNVRWRTARLGLCAGPNVMARAREARYRALYDAARQEGASWVAVGHHADDRAETLLMRLMRGTGPAGLAVFGVRNGILLRPMIRARRSDVLRHLARHGIAYAQDPTNADRRHLRAAVRHEVLPVLERHSPRIVEHLCELADDMAALGVAPVRGVGRAQLRALGRAVADRDGAARVALPGGRVARLDLASGGLVVEPMGTLLLSGSNTDDH